MDICEKLRWMADKHCNELIEAAEEIERLREERKSYSAAVENLDAEVAAQRRAANEHRNAAMEADLRTQAAVRSEKKALAENATLKLACETNNRLLDERTEQLNKLDATAAHWLQKAHEYQTENTALRALLETPNAELRGAKPIGEASRSNDVLGVD